MEGIKRKGEEPELCADFFELRRVYNNNKVFIPNNLAFFQGKGNRFA